MFFIYKFLFTIIVFSIIFFIYYSIHKKILKNKIMENINCIKKKGTKQKTHAILDNFVDYYILCTEKKY